MKNFVSLAKNEMYAINGGNALKDIGRGAAYLALSTAVGGAAGVAIGAYSIFEPYIPKSEPKSGDELVFGGYHFKQEGNALKPTAPVTYGLNVYKHKNGNSSSEETSKTGSSSKSK